jgi:hypothetical protein
MRIAMSDNSVSTEAVLFSLLSLPSIHRDGNTIWAARSKQEHCATAANSGEVFLLT